MTGWDWYYAMIAAAFVLSGAASFIILFVQWKFRRDSRRLRALWAAEAAEERKRLAGKQPWFDGGSVRYPHRRDYTYQQWMAETGYTEEDRDA